MPAHKCMYNNEGVGWTMHKSITLALYSSYFHITPLFFSPLPQGPISAFPPPLCFPEEDLSLHQPIRDLSQCGDCVLAPGDSERSIFTPASSEMGEVEEEGGSMELLLSSEEDADVGSDTTIYF